MSYGYRGCVNDTGGTNPPEVIKVPPQSLLFALFFRGQRCNEVNGDFWYHKVLKSCPILLSLVCSFLLDKNHKVFLIDLVDN